MAKKTSFMDPKGSLCVQKCATGALPYPNKCSSRFQTPLIIISLLFSHLSLVTSNFRKQKSCYTLLLLSYICHWFEWKSSAVELGRNVAVLTRLRWRPEAVGIWVLWAADLWVREIFTYYCFVRPMTSYRNEGWKVRLQWDVCNCWSRVDARSVAPRCGRSRGCVCVLGRVGVWWYRIASHSAHNPDSALRVTEILKIILDDVREPKDEIW